MLSAFLLLAVAFLDWEARSLRKFTIASELDLRHDFENREQEPHGNTDSNRKHQLVAPIVKVALPGSLG